MGLRLTCALANVSGICGVTYAGASAGDALVGEVTELMECFFACDTGVFGVMIETGALGMMWWGVRVAIVGRAVAGFDVKDAREARGVARVVVFSALGRDVVDGRFAEVVEGVIVDRRSDGVALPAAPAPPMVLRIAGFLFSSPEVTDDSSGSASGGVALDANPVRLAVTPGVARIEGLFKLDPVVERRDVELVRGFDALEGGRVVAVDTAAGRRVPAEAVVTFVAAGRRGGTGSFFTTEDALEAILRRTTDEGEEGGGSECC